MTPEEMMHDVQARIRHAFEDGPGKRPMVRVRLVARVGDNVVDIDQEIPLGDTTSETMEHIQALAIDPFLPLLTHLIASHFRAQAYRLSELPEDTAP